jgi:hypothetical protein
MRLVDTCMFYRKPSHNYRYITEGLTRPCDGSMETPLSAAERAHADSINPA